MVVKPSLTFLRIIFGGTFFLLQIDQLSNRAMNNNNQPLSHSEFVNAVLGRR